MKDAAEYRYINFPQPDFAHLFSSISPSYVTYFFLFWAVVGKGRLDRLTHFSKSYKQNQEIKNLINQNNIYFSIQV